MAGNWSPEKSNQWRGTLGYFLLLAAVTVIYLLIRAFGDTLLAPTLAIGGLRPQFATVHVNDLLHVLLALALVIAAARSLGALFRLVAQPPVVGEMIAGILLGPSLLGHVAPHFAAYVMPQSIAPLLNIIAQVGVILYMFLVGLELDLDQLRSRAHATVVISHASIIAPFLLGAGFALYLYTRLSNSSVSFTAFSLFLGVSMSVTAFPVLARILTDRGIHKTKMGTLTLTCAAVDDVSAWCLLAFVVSVTQSRAGHALPVLGMAIGFIVLMIVVVRPIVLQISRFIDTKGRLTQGALALVLLSILLSSLATESIGIHAIFGAFALGAIIPHGSEIARELTGKLEDFVVVFLLPAFFAFTGLRTQIGLLNTPHQWLMCGLIIAIASIGKFGGSAIAARVSGLEWREASALGVLMNTRGLMELIVLNIGLELGVISPTLFAMLVIMALATTFATTPILHFIISGRELAREASAIERASHRQEAVNERVGMLLPVSHPSGVANLVKAALQWNDPEAPPPRVLALVRRPEESIGAGIRDSEEPSPFRSPILAAAIDVAWSQGAVVTPQAVWTTNPASDILRAAEKSQVRWIFLESRRSPLAPFSDKLARRGVVAKVLKRGSAAGFHVAVLTESDEPLDGPITCFLGGEDSALATYELSVHLARASGQRLTICETGTFASADLPDAGESVLLQRIRLQPDSDLCEVAPAPGIVVVSADVLSELPLLTESFTRDRNLIYVQGGVLRKGETASSAIPLQVATA